jgi:thiosulfate/3-mercaptopyruvate sulfurtransferase
MPWLINSTQLEKFRKNQKNIVILDASLHLDGRDAKAEFIEKHIIDAQFFNIKEFSEPQTDLPHMLLMDEKKISEQLGKLGIRNDYKIILYDNSETRTASRALWMFKVFGHNPQLLYVLDGGFKSWEREGGKIDSGEPSFSSKTYQAQLQKQFISTLQDVKHNLTASTDQMVDMRHPVRYAGGPEPRPGLRQGHLPGSFCFPYFTLFNKDGTFLNTEKFRKKCIELGIDMNAPIITTCGSGLTAPILNFLLDLNSHDRHTVYDGSWSEWGVIRPFPGETSLNERPIESCVDN